MNKEDFLENAIDQLGKSEGILANDEEVQHEFFDLFPVFIGKMLHMLIQYLLLSDNLIESLDFIELKEQTFQKKVRVYQKLLI